MLNIRFIIKMLGMMFILETLFMLAATAVAFLYEGNDFYPLLQSSGIMFGTGVLFMLIGLRANEHTAGRREGMLTVTLTWALFSLLGMLPFYLGGYIDNVTDAYFETMSGFTTTGSTILTLSRVVRPAELHSRSAEENCTTENVSSLRSVKVLEKIRAMGIGAPCGNYYKGTIENAANLVWAKGIVPLADIN